jgi:hypothetical protein
MNWNEIFQWSQKGFIACGALVLQLTLILVVGQEAREAKQRAAHAPCSRVWNMAARQPARTDVSDCDK